MEDGRLSIGRFAAAAISLLAALAVVIGTLWAPGSDATEHAGTQGAVGEVAVAGATVSASDPRASVFELLVYACGVERRATGFVTEYGLLSAAHVAAGAHSVMVTDWPRPAANLVAPIAGLSVDLDALMVENLVDAEPIPMELAPLRASDAVTLIGSQRDRLESIPARVQLRADGEAWGYQGELVVLDRQVPEGFSGGPVLNQQGEVVAMMVAIDEASAVTLAVPTARIVDWLDATGAMVDPVSPEECDAE